MAAFRWRVGGCGCGCGCLYPCAVARKTSVANIAALAERYYRRNASPLTIDGLAADDGSGWRELVAPPPGLEVDESVVSYERSIGSYTGYYGLRRPRPIYSRDGRWLDAQGGEISEPRFIGPVAALACAGSGSARLDVRGDRIASVRPDDAIVAARLYGGRAWSALSSAYETSIAAAIDGAFVDVSVDVGDWASYGDDAGIWTTVRVSLQYRVAPFTATTDSPGDPDERLTAASLAYAMDTMYTASRSRTHLIWGTPSATFYIPSGPAGYLAGRIAPSPTAAHRRYCETYGYRELSRGTLACERLYAEDVYDLDGSASLDGAATAYGAAATAPEMVVYDGAIAVERAVVFSYEWRGVVGWTVGGRDVTLSEGWSAVRPEILSYWRETLPVAMARYLEVDRPRPSCRLLLAYGTAVVRTSRPSPASTGACLGFEEAEI